MVNEKDIKHLLSVGRIKGYATDVLQSEYNGKQSTFDGVENVITTPHIAGTSIEAQEKTGVNQEPFFAMFDDDHVAFDDATTYPNSTFAGAKVFAFATSDTATTDTVLGMKVKYNTVNNVGDIVFDADHTSGSFTYRSDTNTLTKRN